MKKYIVPQVKVVAVEALGRLCDSSASGPLEVGGGVIKGQVTPLPPGDAL